MTISKLLVVVVTAAMLMGGSIAQAQNSGVFNPVFETFTADTLRNIAAEDPDLSITREGEFEESGRPYFMFSYKSIPVLVSLICAEPDKCGSVRFYANYGDALAGNAVDMNNSNRGSLFGWHVLESSGSVGYKHVLLAKGITGQSFRSNVKLFAAAFVLSYERLKKSTQTVSYTPQDGAGIDAEHLPKIDLIGHDQTERLAASFTTDFDLELFLSDPQNTGEARNIINQYLHNPRLQ